MDKNKIRKEKLQERLALSPEEVTGKSGRILKRLLQLDEYRRAGTLMIYLDFRKEVQTGELIKHSMEHGKKVVVPVTDMKNRRLIPSLLIDYPEDLAPGAWGILEPDPGCIRPLNPQEIDLVVVPGVAFDEKGNRLGYGGGFYDRFLPQTRPGSFFAATVFEIQILPQLHPEPHDCPVHCLITEERVIYVKAPPSPR